MSARPWVGGLLLSLAAVLVPSAAGADKEAIDQAVARGVASLKQIQMPDGTWPHAQQPGATALAALTLLECGVPPDDPAVQRAAAQLRQASLRTTHTYSLALCNLFFDRLGHAGDVALIESITVRLLGGQSSQGGWSYVCPDISEQEARRLTNHLAQQPQLATRSEPPKAGMQRTPKDLPQEIRNQLARIASRPTGADQAALLQRDDNSNTQFAILGLWVSRRHGLPVDAALGRTERYFRRTQNADAGWGYLPGQGPGPGLGTTSTPPMTCAGLLGLALGYGATGEAVLRTATTKAAGNVPAKGSGRNPENDRAVKAGLALLATAVGVPTGKKFGPRLPLGLRPEVLDPVPRGTLDYYFLWSLERVAVIYDLKTLGKKDWYAWGAELLLEHQDAAGSWTGRYAQGGVDTCFALLFLRRANPASDLTNALRGRLREAGDVQLRAGGFNQDKTKPTSSATGTAASTSPDGANLTKPTVSQPEVKPVALPTTPPAGPGDRTPERRQLTESLVSATAARQPAVLTALVESKGAVYTDALAAAIPKLTGEAKQKARDGLAKRLARMTVPTLRDKFKDTDVEVRRAAALAVELKGERRLIPDLIGLLDDTERPVSRAAQAALKEMTRQDFGPPAQAAPAERAQAVARWKAWWATQKPD